MEEGTIGKAVRDFLTTSEGELFLNEGDIVQITKIKDMHWCYGHSAGKEGLIPTNYIMEIEIPIIEENQELFASLADFLPQQAGDLSFARGEIIVGLNPEGENWWKGMVGERIGLFPTTFVWKLNSSKYKKSSQNSILTLKARVTTSMKAQLDEEMDLNEGEIITITGIVDKTWYRGVCGDRQGIFPKDFVKLLNEDDGNYREPITSYSNFSLPFDSHNSEFSDFSAHDSGENFSGNVQQNTLINFSPEEPKASSSSAFSSHDFSSTVEELSDVFSSKVRSNEIYANQFDDLGISPYGITLYPFYGQFDNELSFHEGEIVTLLRHIDNDWIEGEIEGKKGIMPVSYVNIVVDCEYSFDDTGQSNSSQSIVTNSLKQNAAAKVMYNFHAQMDGDISVREGEEVFISELVNDNWCRVKNSTGTIGLCPLNYLSPVVAPKDPFSPERCPSNDGLPMYNDIFMAQDSNVEIRKPSTTVDPMSNIFLPFSSNRPSSIDDMIAKNIVGLDFDCKTNKSATSDEIKSHSLELRTRKQNSMTNTCANVGVDNNQNSKIKPERPKPPNSRLSLPAILASTSTTPTHGAIETKEDVLYSEVQKRKSVQEFPKIDSVEQSLQESANEEVVFRRQGSDRVPHRPAPPIPVPGQTPVRRSLKRNVTSSKKVMSSQRSIEMTNNLNKVKEDECSIEPVNSASVDRRMKDSEQRQNVISELAITEKEYVRDLKLTYETFHLHNEEFLESRGIDVKTIFGNIIEVMQVAEDLLDKILFSMKNKSDDEQLIGPCFLELADRMKTIYGSYCMNHETAIALLEKYESNENIQKIFDKGIETLKYQVACFDMGSILIKPVQRILRYPLILNELIKCTDDSHKDKPLLLEAVRRMTEVAYHINEFKRRKDLVSKYLDDGNATLSDRMSKLSLHSVLKKSSRLGMKLSSSLGIGLTAKDPEFDVHELLFRSIEKSVKCFVKNVEIFYSGLEEVITCQCTCGEILSSCFKENNDTGVAEFRDTQNTIMTKYLMEFKTVIESRVLKPLNILIDLFEGPDKLIQKRNDKLLDYNKALARPDKARESKLMHDEILLSKNNYDALNSQLLEELPKLSVLSNEIFLECIAAFISARKLFTGRATKQYLSLCENSLTSPQGNVLEVFSVKYSLVLNQIGRFSFVTKNFSCEPSEKSNENKSPVLGNRQPIEVAKGIQSDSQRVYLQNRYPRDKLYSVKTSHVSTDALDLSVSPGNIVAVIKNQDPMGSNKRWFVDIGGTQGFLPSGILDPLYKNVAPSDERSKSLPRRHSTEQKLLSNEPADRSGSLVGTSSKHNVPYSPPPTYEEVFENDDGDSLAASHCHMESSDRRYEEPNEDSSFSSHVYAEIPDDCTPVNEFYYALYDFNGSGPHTLPITSGQVVKVKNFQDLLGNQEWWLVEDRSGISGYVPGNYLKKYN